MTSPAAPPEPVAGTLRHLFRADHVTGASGAAAYTLRKVGRNEVWQVTATCGPARTRHYAKWWRSPEMFRRELEGLRIVEALASRLSWVTAPTVTFADETTGVIVVRDIPGSSGEQVISAALRRLPPPRNRAAHEHRAAGCVSMILEFLEHLHQVPLPRSAHLAAHGPTAVVARANALAERLRTQPSLEDDAGWKAFPLCLGDFAIADTPRECLVHGDPSPGNYLVDESRLGVLDFEDLGVGPACRDLLWIDYCLEQYDRMWHYRSAGRLRRVIPHSRTDPGLGLLYRLEFLLIHLTTIATRPQRRTVFARCSDRLERDHVMWSLRRHCDLVTRG